MNLRRTAVITLIVLAQLGCKDMSQLRTLVRDLNEDLAPARLGVALTDQILLTVTVADAKLAEGPCDGRVGFALRVGRSLREHYPPFDGLQVVNVAFGPDFDGTLPSRPQLPIRFAPAVMRAASQATDSMQMFSSCQAFEELNPR